MRKYIDYCKSLWHCLWDTAFMRKISSWWEEKILNVPESNRERSARLAIAVIVGIPFALIMVGTYKFFNNDYIPHITDYIAFISIPVLFVLWLFRTHDVREQIEKTQENINSELYSKGVELLASENGINRRNGLLIMSIVRRRRLLKKEINIITSSGLNLEQAHLPSSNLAEMDLPSINLKRANLMTANLRKTFLFRADLRNAVLVHANLADAFLRHANLSHTNLARANLVNADLKMADLEGANLEDAILTSVDLATTKLIGAKYNHKTIFPEGFNPEEHGMIKKE